MTGEPWLSWSSTLGECWGWGRTGKICLNQGEPCSRAKELDIRNVDSWMLQVVVMTPKFLSRNVSGMAPWSETGVMERGWGCVLELASKRLYLDCMFTWGWLWGRGGGNDLRSCPKATSCSNHTVLTYLGLLRGGGQWKVGGLTLGSVLGEWKLHDGSCDLGSLTRVSVERHSFIHPFNSYLLNALMGQVAEWNLDIPEFKSYFYHLLTVWPWTAFIESPRTSVSLSLK